MHDYLLKPHIYLFINLNATLTFCLSRNRFFMIFFVALFLYGSNVSWRYSVGKKNLFCLNTLHLFGKIFLRRMFDWPQLLISLVKSTTMNKIFWEFWLLYQIFFSPQVKWSVIISNKHGIHELPHKLPNTLRLRILGN